jgi:hypothetical protein
VDSILLATQEGDLAREPGSFTLSFEDGSVRRPFDALVSLGWPQGVFPLE